VERASQNVSVLRTITLYLMIVNWMMLHFITAVHYFWMEGTKMAILLNSM